MEKPHTKHNFSKKLEKLIIWTSIHERPTLQTTTLLDKSKQIHT